MKKFAAIVLSLLTRMVLSKFRPVVIGITGSVGKTTTRDAVSAVLSVRFSTRASIKSYNNEFGLPFTVLGQEYPGKNPFAWALLIFNSFRILLGEHYPQMLVLEMGSDAPGDIEKLLKMTGPLNYAIITDIGISHLMNYPSREALAKEKLSLIKGLKPNGTAILNYDNDAILKFIRARKNSLQIISYGLDQESDVAASEVQIVKKDGNFGLMFKVKYKGTVVPFMLPDMLGRSNVYAVLAAISVGLSTGMNMVEIGEGLAKFEVPPGRLKLMAGIKRTKIIDDSYNSAPASAGLALEVLLQTAEGRKVAALGGMAELGTQNEVGHKEIAAKIQEVGVELLFLVGENSKIIKNELESRNFAGVVKYFENSDNARIPIQNELREGDTILVKGSQSARMEKIVKEIMAEPHLSAKLLVRQSPDWLNS